MIKAYYNEIDPFAAQWLRNLISKNLIAQGDVDERSIEDVRPADLAGYAQCHFFAGIGGWSYALRLAGWDDTRPVWTGSCPCQPFSTAGTGKGTSDERHLWPSWFHLISVCQPCVVFGEQVETAIKYGWLDLVQSDMEGANYSFGAFGIPAGGVGAPHIRQRLYFVADAVQSRLQGPEPQGQPSACCPKAENAFIDITMLAKWRALGRRKFDLLHAHGLPIGLARDAIRGFGNAIVPQVAAEFIKAYMECRP